jgi:hypothetical protein
MSDDEGEEEDPFERLGAPDDREGDPFEQLGGSDVESEDAGNDPAEAGTDDTDETPSDSGDASPESDTAAGTGESETATASDMGFEEEFIDAEQPPGGTEMGSDVDPEEDPFSGMDDRDGDPFGSGESAFEAVDVDTVDEDEVWASLAEDGPATPRQTKRYAEVSKHRFCEQCEYFSEPPNAHCTHDEAEIVEYLDMETVRLLNCPVVAEQREIESDE